MRVYLAKNCDVLPRYGDVPDLTQGDTSVVESFDITDEQGDYIDMLFVDTSNKVCDASLDIGDYQFYNVDQCRLLLDWVENVLNDESISSLYDFYLKLEEYLQYAVTNNTGIAIEL